MARAMMMPSMMQSGVVGAAEVEYETTSSVFFDGTKEVLVYKFEKSINWELHIEKMMSDGFFN